MNLTEEEKERVKVLRNEIRLLEERSARLGVLLEPFQQKCGHVIAKTASSKDFVLVHKGVCPDCGHIILPLEIINLIKGQYEESKQ